MPLNVTALYLLPLSAIFFLLWIRVSALRAATGVSFGDGGNPALLHRMRQHGNFVEWVPMVLFALLAAESTGASSTLLHVAGGLLVIGRVAHPIGLRADNPGHPLRYVGNGSNILALLLCCGLIVANIL